MWGIIVGQWCTEYRGSHAHGVGVLLINRGVRFWSSQVSTFIFYSSTKTQWRLGENSRCLILDVQFLFLLAVAKHKLCLLQVQKHFFICRVSLLLKPNSGYTERSAALWHLSQGCSPAWAPTGWLGSTLSTYIGCLVGAEPVTSGQFSFFNGLCDKSSV